MIIYWKRSGDARSIIPYAN